MGGLVYVYTCRVRYPGLICLQEENIQACLPLDYTKAEYDYNNKVYGIYCVVFLKYSRKSSALKYSMSNE